MTRSFVGVACLVALLLAPVHAGAQHDPHVKVSKSAQEATISLQAGGLQVVQKLTRNTLDLRLSDGHDRVHFTGDLAGNVTVQRGAKRHAFSMRTPSPSDQTALLSLLSESTALQTFATVMNTAWGRTSKGAAVFRSAHALMEMLRGDTQPVAALVATLATPKMAIVPARRDGPDACWSAYTRDVLRYTYDLEGCVAEARESWFPLHLAWCAYEYDIKTSLAFVWMLDCYSLI